MCIRDRYKDAPDVRDMGAIVQPNLERVHAAKPDLILITSLPVSYTHLDVYKRQASRMRWTEAVRVMAGNSWSVR